MVGDPSPHIVALDEQSVALVVDIDPERVILFQALFELTEYIGIPRTLDAKRGTVCIITTRSMVDYCVDVFDSCRNFIDWRTPLVVPEVTLS